ncbi:MAG: glycerophosphodiester phosphodiesterase [Clostridia bacterium]|nr:glycerophosphodiester phosphodiesterase [Clostridia bacterium]
MALLWISVALLCLAALYLWCVAPARRRPDASAFVGRLYAHRGLHDGNQKIIENSLTAFGRAVDAGYGIELDVQRTADGQAVVFHDGDLRRVCGAGGKLRHFSYEELKAFPLPDGTAIPLFSEVLRRVDGKVPLIVEIKHEGGAARNTALALEVLRDYTGPYCMESFHPLSVRYLKRHAPKVLRGQLADGGRWNADDMALPSHFALKHLLVNMVGRPHFVAYSYPKDHTLAMWLMKRVYRPYLAAWTIYDQKILEKAHKGYEMLIFEGFSPAD